ncbi:nuclear transport factor 2 family protein [Colwellia hornerae]|uniref:Nuclear transport factor 2 family protein n=1 Tax=Colwellia hornerae TaxID=89402 RepID=A0A5C6QMV2_9GAMM|nr:nuclear transport factor 2 family protein [Colwellia hornerae]TWX53632.1 nuclear transport factor 2 family protein [Colwellia hornerae]TWX60283.1 nuclear transport factor 2 family protein [Colwellia hornerae]TWX70038.1 nuclear transport factor 2 family protein [Colwellia hornerae]
MQNNAPQDSSTPSPLWLDNFVKVYQTLSTDNLDLLSTIYHGDVVFIDPIHQLKGFNNLFEYFKNLYENLTTCDFVINNVITDKDQAAIYWTMSYQHPKLNKGKLITVIGHSHIKGYEDKIIYHRDYLDLGAMLYEQLPVLGKLIKLIKQKAAK